MNYIYDPVFLEHETGMHPENKKRLLGLGEIAKAKISYDESVLSLIHGKAYIEKVKNYSKVSRSLEGETHTSPGSFEAAVYAANATIQAAQGNDFAVVRPPGHHAQANRASGFCIFNNVAIAAKYLADQGKRVLIFDFDGHLGDGTTDIFYDSPQVMYWSIHQYPAYPGRGLPNEIGIGHGAGYTVNAPLPPGAGDDIFFDAFHSSLPIAKAFNPDVLAISAGFDAHQYDLLLQLRLSNHAFYKLGQLLAQNFNNLFGTLEGGYNVEELKKCLFNFVNGINGDPILYNDSPTESDIKIWDAYDWRIQELLITMKKYWNI